MLSTVKLLLFSNSIKNFSAVSPWKLEINKIILLKNKVLSVLKYGHVIKKCTSSSISDSHLKQIQSFIGRFSCLPVSILKQCDDKRNLAIAVMSLILVKNNK